MISRLRRMRLTYQLILITTVNVAICLLVLSVFLTLNLSEKFKEDAVDRVFLVGAGIAANSTAALLFNDPAAATHTLDLTLSGIREIRKATILDKDGNVFASFAITPQDKSEVAAEKPWLGNGGIRKGEATYAFINGGLEVLYPVTLKGEKLGQIHLISDMAELQEGLRQFYSLIFGLALLSLSVSALISSWLQRLITRPIHALIKTMNRVSDDGAYSVRVPEIAKAELGSLITGFNYMLSRIEAEITQRSAIENDLQAAKVVAERANDAKSRFLAAASHDLRQPLQALSLYLGVLAGRLAPQDRSIMGHIEICTGSLNELLRDLLDLSKLDANVVTPNISNFRLADLFNSLLSTHAPAAEAKGLRAWAVSTEIWVNCDPVLFERVVGNLVANAIRYTQKGGVLIGCRRRHGAVWVEVVDTGIGIPEEKLGEIFEEFRQLGNDERSREKGSGLGLAIVKRTATLLGLDVRVTSRLGRGSTFAVSVPLGVPTGNDETRPSGNGRSLYIVLAEDDANVRDALSLSLTAIGHTVVEASSSEKLLARMEGAAPDFIIADYRLSDGDTGLDVVAQVRAKFGEKIPAAILTGDTNPSVVRKITTEGIAVLYKPIRLEALKAAIAGSAPANSAV